MNDSPSTISMTEKQARFEYLTARNSMLHLCDLDQARSRNP